MNEQRGKAGARRTKVVGAAKRLAVREYVPLACWVLSWFMIGLAVGHADAVRLLAANAFVSAIRHVCTIEAMQVLCRRVGSDETIFNAARRAALRIELGSLIGSVAATALIAAMLASRGLNEAAVMVVIAAGAIPARNPAALLVAERKRVPMWRIGSSITFAVGSGLVLLLGFHWMAAAAVLASREWGGLIATLLFAPPRKPERRVRDEPLTFAEAAQRTESSARQRLSYRLISAVATLVLGPFGNVAARTSRELGRLDSRLARLVPRKKSGFFLFTLGTAGTAGFFLFVSREPSTFFAAAAFTRLAASGATVLLWWRYGGPAGADEEMDED